MTYSPWISQFFWLNIYHPFGPSRRKSWHRNCPSGIQSISFWPIQFFQFLIFSMELELLFFHLWIEYFHLLLTSYSATPAKSFPFSLSTVSPTHYHVCVEHSYCTSHTWRCYLLFNSFSGNSHESAGAERILTTLLSKPEQMVL